MSTAVGYWNDYPDYLTQGHDLAELQYMLRDLRDGINVMVREGEIPSAVNQKQDGDMVFDDVENAIAYLHENS